MRNGTQKQFNGALVGLGYVVNRETVTGARYVLEIQLIDDDPHDRRGCGPNQCRPSCL